MTPLRAATTWLFRRIVGLYFREIEVLGDAPDKATASCLFVSNHVNAIIDPILIFVTSPCDISPVAKSTLWKVPGLRWLLGVVDAVQIVRRVDDPTKQGGSNNAAFDHVATWLQRGGNILIFPEGTSHNEPHLVELKSGAARMLLRACEVGPPAALTFQSVALEFDARDEFRSRVLILYGPVRSVADIAGLDEKEASAPLAGSRRSPEAADAFVTKITDKIRADLSELLVEGESWDEYRLIARVAEMFAHDAGDPTLAAWNALGRQVEAARKMLAGDLATFEAVLRAVTAYYAKLDAIGLTDADIAGPKAPAALGLGRKLTLALTLPFAALGIVAYAPPYWAMRIIAERIKSADEISTVKLGAGMVIFPLWAILLVALSIWLAPWPWSLTLAALSLLTPFAAVVWSDATPELRRSLRALFRGGGVEQARVLRAAAMVRLKEAQAKLGL